MRIKKGTSRKMRFAVRDNEVFGTRSGHQSCMPANSCAGRAASSPGQAAAPRTVPLNRRGETQRCAMISAWVGHPNDGFSFACNRQQPSETFDSDVIRGAAIGRSPLEDDALPRLGLRVERKHFNIGRIARERRCHAAQFAPSQRAVHPCHHSSWPELTHRCKFSIFARSRSRLTSTPTFCRAGHRRAGTAMANIPASTTRAMHDTRDFPTTVPAFPLNVPFMTSSRILFFKLTAKLMAFLGAPAPCGGAVRGAG